MPTSRPRQRLDRPDARPAIILLHVSPLLPLREVIDPAGRITDPERPLLQAKQRQEQHRVGVDEVKAQYVGTARNQPARCRPALYMRATVVQVLVAPHLQEQVARPSALRLDLDAGHVAGTGGDEQIPEAALEVLRQRSLGDTDDTRKAFSRASRRQEAGPKRQSHDYSTFLKQEVQAREIGHFCQVFSFRVRKSGSAHGGLYEAEQFVRAKRFDHHRHRPEPLSGCGYLNINRSGDQNGR